MKSLAILSALLLLSTPGWSFEDTFDRAELGDVWKTHPNAFSIRDGYLVVQQQAGTDHGAVGEALVNFGDAALEFRFRFSGSPSFNFVIDDKNYKESHAGHICRVRFTPKQLTLGDDKFGVMEKRIFAMRRSSAEEKAQADKEIEGTLAHLPVDLKPDTWYLAKVILSGDTMTFSMNGKRLGSLTSPGIAHPTKTDFGFTVNGGEMHFDDVSLTPLTDRQAGTWPIERLQSEVPEYRIEDPDAPIQSILYQGEPVDGKTTEVFAFYASPKTLGKANEGESFPGIVLIHGGGGTAFSDWVWMWAQRGYAAIAMDLSGRRPPAPTYDEQGVKVRDYNHKREQRTLLEKGGIDHGRPQKFDSIGGTIDDDWPYHAVANVMKAHTLLRSFEEVDAECTAVTGISWGGYTTCLAASLDDRFKAAIPVYGCGFLHEGESVQKPSIDALGDRRDAWVAAYDPGSHLAKCRTPVLWVNGTHDQHYVLDSYAKSYRKVQGSSTFRIEPRMGHSHGAGWAPEEIGIFVDSILKGGTPLPTVGPLETENDGTVSATIQSGTTITRAELHYTTESGLRKQRQWSSLPAAIEKDRVVAKGLPNDANTWLITITDERDALVTSEVGFR